MCRKQKRLCTVGWEKIAVVTGIFLFCSIFEITAPFHLLEQTTSAVILPERTLFVVFQDSLLDLQSTQMMNDYFCQMT